MLWSQPGWRRGPAISRVELHHWGRVGAGVVTATFYNFNRELVAPLIPAAWDVTSPDEIMAIRYATLDAAFGRLLGPEVLESADMAEPRTWHRSRPGGFPVTTVDPCTRRMQSSTGRQLRISCCGTPSL